MKQIRNTAPLINKEGQGLSRRFLGKTENFKDKAEEKFYQKMLKYYCKGKTTMPFGFRTEENGMRVPNFIPVLQEYYYKNIN